MNFFLVLCVVLATVSLSSGAELRKARSFKLSQKKGLKLQNMASTATFPASPMYAIVEQYSDAACTTVTQGNSYILDTCLASSVSSNLYTCASGTGSMTSYSDTTCTTANGAADSFTVGDCVASGGGGYMKIVSCGSDSTAYSTKLITNKVFQLAGCSQNLGSDAYPNDSCMDMSDGVDVYSIQINWPKVKVYGTTDCSGAVLDTSSISTSCEDPGTDDDSELDYNTYSKASYSSAFSNLSFGFGALVSALMVALQLMKN